MSHDKFTFAFKYCIRVVLVALSHPALPADGFVAIASFKLLEEAVLIVKKLHSRNVISVC